MSKVKPKAIPFTSYQIFVVSLLALLQFTVVLDFMILSPLGEFLMKSLDIKPAGFGLVVSSYAISAGVAGILAAGYSDKFDRKKMLLFFYIGFIIGTVFCGLANTFWTLLAARIVTGLFGGVIGAIVMAIVTDLFALNQRGKVMGFVQMGFAASQVLGIPLGLFFATRFGWHYAFFMIVAAAIIIAVLIAVKMKPVDHHLSVRNDKNPFVHLWHTLGNKNYQVSFVATAFLSVGGFMMMPFGSAYAVNNLGVSPIDLEKLFFATGLSSIVIMPLVGKLSDKYDKFTIFVTGSAIAVIMVIIYTNLPPTPLWELIVINIILFMGIMSRIVPATTLNSAVPEMKDRGAFMSINGSLQYMAGGIAAIVAGLVIKRVDNNSPLQHYDILGYIVSGVTIVCAFLVYRVSKMVKSKIAEQKVPDLAKPVEAV